MTAIQVFAFFIGVVVAIATTNWLNAYMFWILALIGGIAAGAVVFQIVVSLYNQITKNKA